jgi:hypothetical protein
MIIKLAPLVTKQNVAQKPTVVLLHELNDYVVNYIEHGANEKQTVKKETLVVYRNQRFSTLYFIQSCFQFTYLGTALTDQNFIQEEIKKRLKSENACYLSV